MILKGNDFYSLLYVYVCFLHPGTHFVFLYTGLVVFVATRCFIEKYRSPMVAMIKRPMLQTAGGVAILANFHGHILQRRHVFY